jgi:hypothetical protein
VVRRPAAAGTRAHSEVRQLIRGTGVRSRSEILTDALVHHVCAALVAGPGLRRIITRASAARTCRWSSLG